MPITKRHWEAIRYKRVSPRRPDYFAGPEEVRAWIEWLKDHRQLVYFRLAMFLVLTGTRIGEAAGMCWSEVDLERRHARVIRVVLWDHKTRRPVLEERAKTDGSIRILMLPEILVNILREMKHENDGNNVPVFANQKGGLLKYNAIQSAFNAGFKEAKLPWRSTHICRHTYATLALMATHDLGGVQAALGHKSQKMTEKYAKNVALLRSETAEKTASFLQLGVK